MSPAPAEPDRALSLLDRAELGAVGVALAFLTNALLGPLFAPTQIEPQASEGLRLIWPPVYAVALGVCALHPDRLRRVWPAAVVIAGLLGWPFLSKLWSLDPETTQRRSIALAFTTLFGMMLAARYSWRRLVNLLAVVMGVLAVMSLCACLAFPTWAIDKSANPGDWKGVWYEKNALGANMALGALAALSSALMAQRRRWIWVALVVLEVLLIGLSRSATSAVVFLAGCAILTGLAMVRRGPVWTVVAGWLALQGAGLIAAAAWLAPDKLLKAMGKDPTLTGRTDIWAALLRRVAERPWQGYGYQAFWSIDRHGPAAIVRREARWTVPNAHNGWLELLVQLGWVGVTLFALNYLLSLGTAAVGAPWRRDGGFAMVYVVIFGIFSLSESYILQHNSISWVLYVAVMAKLFERAPVRAAVRAPQHGPPAVLAASGV